MVEGRRFRAGLCDYRMREESITSYTSEQNGVAERFFRYSKEECVWQHVFADIRKPAARFGLDALERGGPASAHELPEPCSISGSASTILSLDEGGALQPILAK